MFVKEGIKNQLEKHYDASFLISLPFSSMVFVCGDDCTIIVFDRNKTCQIEVMQSSGFINTPKNTPSIWNLYCIKHSTHTVSSIPYVQYLPF